MAISVLVFSAIFVLTQGSVLDPVNIHRGSPDCGENEYLNDCASSCPKTCSNRHTQVYQICVAKCSVKCDCLPGTLRNDDGVCVPMDECSPPICGDIEEFNVCGTSCPKTCKNINNPPEVCTKECVKGCFCSEGYVRDNNNRCVEKKECNLGNSAFASANAHSSASVSALERMNPVPLTNLNAPCADPNAERLPCASPYNCRPSCKIRNPNPVHCELTVCVVDDCQCKPGHILSKPGGVCIKENECPAKHRKT